MRLIDADKVEGKLRNIIPKIENLKNVIPEADLFGFGVVQGIKKAINEFYNAPTIEVEKRCDMCKIMKTGQGRIRLYDGNGWQVAIGRGVGGYELVISHLGEHFATKIDYCPYCGAKMDGGEKNEDGVD